MFDEMRRAGVAADEVAYNSLINLYCKMGERHLSQARALLQTMREEGRPFFQPDSVEV